MTITMMKEIWITNFTKKDILIEDLGVKIPKMSIVNLFRYNLLEENILKSIQSGSIFKKSKYIRVRHTAPEFRKERKLVSDQPSIRLQKSGFTQEKKEYDELRIDDELFSSQFGDGEFDENEKKDLLWVTQH